MRPLNRITYRKWQAMQWRDPRTDLVNLGKSQHELPDATVYDLIVRRTTQRRVAVAAGELQDLAFARRLARPRQPARWVLVRMIAQPQLDRVDAELDRELVHRALEREQAADIPRRAHRRRRVDVELDQPV